APEGGESGDLANLVADREACVPQRVQDGAHEMLLGRADLAVEQEEDVDVGVQAQLTTAVAAERDDQAGGRAAHSISEERLEETVDAIGKLAQRRASALAARRGRRQLRSRAVHRGAPRRHARYAIGAGSDELPIRYASTPRAQLRPSAIAQTISDWPRCMSPAANTPGTF